MDLQIHNFRAPLILGSGHYFSLLYRASHVPVGDDQLQHLELARDIARSFNSTYGENFPEPKPLLGLSTVYENLIGV